MQFTTAVILAAAGLAAAAPQKAALERRIDQNTYNCGLDMYPSATTGPIRDGVSYLRSETEPIWGDANKCNLVSCSYGTGIFICGEGGLSPSHYPFEAKQIGDKVEDAYEQCYGGTPDGDGTYVRAFQRWEKDYNILVTGGQKC